MSINFNIQFLHKEFLHRDLIPDRSVRSLVALRLGVQLRLFAIGQIDDRSRFGARTGLLKISQIADVNNE